MQTIIESIPIREVLHFLGWRGTPIEPELVIRINRMIETVRSQIQPYVAVQRFCIEPTGCLQGTLFIPQGSDIHAMLASCDEAVLLAATLGAQSERMLLKEQARNKADALLLDAVLSAAIEAVCDREEAALRLQCEKSGLYLTDRFSPGYGDMPIAQAKEICEVLQNGKTIGLTVSQTGIMIPRKSVTAMMGISRVRPKRRSSGCAACAMRDSCPMAKKED